MADLTTDALAAFQVKEEARKKIEAEARRRASDLSKAETADRILECRKWAQPILDAMFGEREWAFRNPTMSTIEVYIDERHTKTLLVHESGAITGVFQATAGGGHYSNSLPRYDNVKIRDLAHLGALLATERECIDSVMRYAD